MKGLKRLSKHDYQNSWLTTNPLSVEKLLEIGETILSNIVTSCSEIAVQTINEIQQVSKFFQLFTYSKKDMKYFLICKSF